VLAKIKAAGAKDWRAHVEFLRLAFAEYRFGNSPQVNVALQQNMVHYDPERAKLIAELEQRRARALADKGGASEPLQLEDASDAREIAEEAQRMLAAGSRRSSRTSLSAYANTRRKPLLSVRIRSKSAGHGARRRAGMRSTSC